MLLLCMQKRKDGSGKEAMLDLHRKSSGENMPAASDLYTKDLHTNGLKRLPGSWQGKGFLITIGVLVSLSTSVKLEWNIHFCSEKNWELWSFSSMRAPNRYRLVCATRDVFNS
jgi:hypothetical protein